MMFFFPDSMDLVDPSFDFIAETRSPNRVRQRDDVYAHELLDPCPHDGILVSKAIVDGIGQGSGKYTLAQRNRLLRVGVREFFRLDACAGKERLATMGDCGAFSYVKEVRPPFGVSEVLDFYMDCQFDCGLSVDHVILGYDSGMDDGHLPGVDPVPEDWRDRQRITLDLAAEFLAEARRRKFSMVPIGVAQGWSPLSYASAVQELQEMGYTYIAIGGVVPLKTSDLNMVMDAVASVRAPDTRFHLLGVTRCEQMTRYRDCGVVSFDSTSPLRRAFKDEKVNYYTLDGFYSAIRVPQVEGNPKLQRLIAAGEVDQGKAIRLERACLDALNAFGRDACSADEVLGLLAEYERLVDGSKSRVERYRSVLRDKPWRDCSCAICRQLGIHVVLFRGAERNRRRGFHNVHVFAQRMQRQLNGRSGRGPGTSAGY